MQQVIDKIDIQGEYSVNQVAEWANVPTDTVYNYIRNNRDDIERQGYLIYTGGIEVKRYKIAGELAREIVAKSFSNIYQPSDD